MAPSSQHWIRAASLANIQSTGCTVVQVQGQTLAIVRDRDRLHVIDNRCPHMGFPLDRGSVSDGILTCHWHHARFDLCTGGTFDQWADDVRAYPVDIRGDEVWIDMTPRADPRQHHLERLQVGLERGIPLIIGKAILPLLEGDSQAVEAFRIGLEFGTRYRRAGWRQGLNDPYVPAESASLARRTRSAQSRLPRPVCGSRRLQRRAAEVCRTTSADGSR